MLVAAILIVFPFCMLFAAASDLLSMTIANRVPLILLVAFAAIAPLTGMPMDQYGMHFLAGLAVLFLTFGLFALGGMGGGDAKLLSATALWIGFDLQLVQYLLLASAIGGALTLAIIFYRRSPLAVYTGGNIFLRNLADADVGVPYGIALGLGGLLAYPETPLMLWAFEKLATA